LTVNFAHERYEYAERLAGPPATLTNAGGEYSPSSLSLDPPLYTDSKMLLTSWVGRLDVHLKLSRHQLLCTVVAKVTEISSSRVALEIDELHGARVILAQCPLTYTNYTLHSVHRATTRITISTQRGRDICWR